MTNITRRAALGATAILAAPAIARAQARFPDRPITILVPFPPGGATDVQMRALAEAATRAFGQNVLVENRPGAGSSTGAEYAAKATADGHTLFLSTGSSMVMNGFLYKNLPYEPLRDFVAVGFSNYLFLKDFLKIAQRD